MTFSTLVLGEGTLLIPCAEILLRHRHPIQAIVSDNDVIRQWAEEQKISCVSRQQDLLVAMDGRPVDYLFSIANLSVIPARILALPRLGAINFHDGPLPRYAGLHATTWAILNQETSHGVTWHEMRETVDTGDILQQRIFALAPDETALTLNRKCFKAGIESFEELVKILGDGSGTPRALPQNLSERTYFAKHTRPAAQACIDWTLPAEHLAAFVRSLDFGPYPNPLEVPKVVGGGHVLLVPKLEVRSTCSESPPGTVLDVDGESVRVATSTNDVVIPQLLTTAGEALDIAAAGIAAGYRFETLPADTAARLTQLGPSMVRHEDFWLQRLLQLAPLELPSGHARTRSAKSRATATLVTPLVSTAASDRADALTAALVLYLARAAGHTCFDIGFGHVGLEESLSSLEQFFALQVPLRVALEADGSLDAALRAVLNELASARAKHTYARSLVARTPELRGRDIRLPVGILQRDEPEDAADNDLTIAVSRDGRTSHWTYRTSVFDHAQILEHQRMFTTFLEHLTAQLDAPLASVPLLTAAERERLLVTWNAPHKAYPDGRRVPKLL